MSAQFDPAAPRCEAHNLRFLMEQQLDHLERLADRGMETAEARELLKRLMDRDRVVRVRMLLSEAERFAAA